MQRTKINQKSFEGQSIYVGIDFHLKNWMVTILGEDYEHKTMSMEPDPEQLVHYLERNFPGAQYKAVYEAGFSGFQSCRRLAELGVDCKVIHAADVPTSQKNRQRKTDKADSRKLARMLKSGEFNGVHIPDEELEADRALIRQRHRTMKDLCRLKQRIKSLLYEFGIQTPGRFTPGQRWSKVYMNWLRELPGARQEIRLLVANYIATVSLLKQQLLLITGQIRALPKKERYAENYAVLISIPGLGMLGAMSLLTQLGDLDRFRSLDELCSYVGLVPNMHCSGNKMVVGEMTRRGRKELKIMLIEAAWVIVRKDPAMMLRFQELCKRMNMNNAIIRIAKNMLSRIRYLLRNKIEYELGVVK